MVPSKPDNSGVKATASENKDLFGAPKNGKDHDATNTGITNTI